MVGNTKAGPEARLSLLKAHRFGRADRSLTLSRAIENTMGVSMKRSAVDPFEVRVKCSFCAPQLESRGFSPGREAHVFRPPRVLPKPCL